MLHIIYPHSELLNVERPDNPQYRRYRIQGNIFRKKDTWNQYPSRLLCCCKGTKYDLFENNKQACSAKIFLDN